MVILDISTRKESDENEKYLGKSEMSIFNCFENIVRNGAFAPFPTLFLIVICYIGM